MCPAHIGATPPAGIAMRRRRLHRIVLAAAGLWNLAFGVHAAFDPQWLFRFAGMEPLNHPPVFACLGMVVGLYGLLYLEAARVPERGARIVAVGLLGKVLGPIGMAWVIAGGAWPWRAGVLCLGNDVVWWLPFALYLWDARPLPGTGQVPLAGKLSSASRGPWL